MPKAPTIYSEEKSHEMGKKLKSLIDNPKGLVLQDLIAEHRDSILAALRAGHSYEDVCSALAEIDVVIKANTLKQYLKKTGSVSSNMVESEQADSNEKANLPDPPVQAESIAQPSNIDEGEEEEEEEEEDEDEDEEEEEDEEDEEEEDANAS